jgi:aminopeptidase
MINPMYEKLARVAVNFSINVKEGNRVALVGPVLAKELFQALYVEILKAGGHPFIHAELEGIPELKFKYSSDKQLTYVDSVVKQIYLEFDRIIQIQAEYNTNRLATVNPQKLALSQSTEEMRELMTKFQERTTNGELKWVIVPFPCEALAQDAEMDIFTYSEFVANALHIDKEDPVKEWENIRENQAKIIEYLDKVEKIHVLGDDTDLILSTKGRTWTNCYGDQNLPDGEVYTGPVEDSVNGHIRFTFPGIYQGREIKNIYLEFKEGKVINYTADKGEDLLKEILQVENANRIGEFAIVTNYGVKKFTKNMLFDEKMGGTLHCALGLGFEETGSKNMSTIHWDILKDMKPPGSKVIADGEIIYEEGQWKI